MSKYSRKKMSNEKLTMKLAQLELVEGLVLHWLGERSELFYSLCARNYYARGISRTQDVIESFFGTPSGGSLHDDQSELDVFVARTGGAFGSSDYILREHTLLRFYRLFLHPSQLELLIPRKRPASNMLNFPLGLSIGGFQKSHPLKGCAVCRLEDQENKGMSYWRLFHQYPGVWVCLDHSCALQETADLTAKTRGYYWITPGNQDFAPVHKHLMQPAIFSNFQSLAALIYALNSDCEAGAARVVDERLRCHLHAKSSKMLTRTGMLRSIHTEGISEMVCSFLQFVAPYRSAKEFSDLPETPGDCRNLFARYLNCRSKMLPFEQLLLTAWAIGSICKQR